MMTGSDAQMWEIVNRFCPDFAEETLRAMHEEICAVMKEYGDDLLGTDEIAGIEAHRSRRMSAQKSAQGKPES